MEKGRVAENLTEHQRWNFLENIVNRLKPLTIFAKKTSSLKFDWALNTPLDDTPNIMYSMLEYYLSEVSQKTLKI